MSRAYIIGNVDHLRKLFPNYLGKDERLLPDGRLLIEVAENEVLDDPEIQVFTHEEILKYLNENLQDQAYRLAPAGARLRGRRKSKGTSQGKV